MQEFQFVLFQIDQARSHLIAGSLPALRSALLLLDNSAELILDRWINYDLEYDGLWEKIQRQVRDIGVPENHPEFKALFTRRFLQASEKRKVARLFDEKLRYVTTAKPTLSPSIATVLSHLHRYRNQAHHSGRVRRETIRTSVTIALELCCRLLETLRPKTLGYASDGEYSWFESRFHRRPIDFLEDAVLARIVAEFREGLPLDSDSIREILAANLKRRLEDLRERLDFISSECRLARDHDSALTEAQKFTVTRLAESQPYPTIPPNMGAPVSAGELERIELVPSALHNSSSSIAAFEAYAANDLSLERLEFVVDYYVGAIDQAIQAEVDRVRGK